MNVEVRLFAGLREGRFSKERLTLPDTARLDDLLRQLNIQADALGLRLVNGSYAELDHPLAESDVVSLFPPIAGG